MTSSRLWQYCALSSVIDQSWESVEATTKKHEGLLLVTCHSLVDFEKSIIVSAHMNLTDGLLKEKKTTKIL